MLDRLLEGRGRGATHAGVAARRAARRVRRGAVGARLCASLHPRSAVDARGARAMAHTPRAICDRSPTRDTSRPSCGDGPSALVCIAGPRRRCGSSSSISSKKAVIPPAPPSNSTPLALLQGQVRSAPATTIGGCRRSRGPAIGVCSAGFCSSGFGTGAIEPRAITTEDVTRYVREQIPARSPASAQLHASTLRSLSAVSVADGANRA